MAEAVKGRVSSFQTLGTLDGPGIRFVVFLQGCPLQCGCCHNPETQNSQGGEEYTPQQILEMAVKYKSYFGEMGGITVSGGEPLLQAEFVKELFKLCKDNGINTCLDTSGCIINDSVLNLLPLCDLVLLDIKYTDNDKYLKYVGCSLSMPLNFLKELEGLGIPVWIRQVIIPTLNDSDKDLKTLAQITGGYNCVKKVELLPFKKICQTKYDSLNRKFPFEHIPTANLDIMKTVKEKFSQLNTR